MCIRDRFDSAYSLWCFVLICICSGISLFCVLCLYVGKFSQMFIIVPLCGICFISVTLVMSGNSCHLFIACVAKLDLYISGFLYAFR